MAQYLYHCNPCGKTYEIEKPMNLAAQSESCPVCGQAGARVFTPPAVFSKTSGSHSECACESAPSAQCAGCDHGSCGQI